MSCRMVAWSRWATQLRRSVRPNSRVVSARQGALTTGQQHGSRADATKLCQNPPKNLSWPTQEKVVLVDAHKRIISVTLLVVSTAIATWLLTGTQGECLIDEDCHRTPNQYCMSWLREAIPPSKPWWARFQSYRSCETLCGDGYPDCPDDLICPRSAHGVPSICVPSRSE